MLLLLLGLGLVAVAAASSSDTTLRSVVGKATFVGPARTGGGASSATHMRVVDTCATLYSWKGQPPGWLDHAFAAAQAAAQSIPIPGIATAVSTGLSFALGLLKKFKVGGKRSATVNPNSQDGEGIEGVLVGSWTGTRTVSVTVYLQARRHEGPGEPSAWVLLRVPDREEWCSEMQGAHVLSSVIGTWQTSGRPATTGELPPFGAPTFAGEGAWSPAVFENGQRDAVQPWYAAYLRGAPFPLHRGWSGPYGSWVRPGSDVLRAGVVRDGDEYSLRVWLPARAGALRWTIAYRLD